LFQALFRRSQPTDSLIAICAGHCWEVSPAPFLLATAVRITIIVRKTADLIGGFIGQANRFKLSKAESPAANHRTWCIGKERLKGRLLSTVINQMEESLDISTAMGSMYTP